MCNEEPSSKDSFEERVKLYVMGTKEEHRCLCGPSVLADMDPEKQPYQVIRATITTVQLTGDGGAYLMVSALLAALETQPIQEAARRFRQLMGGLAPRNGSDHAKVDFSL